MSRGRKRPPGRGKTPGETEYACRRARRDQGRTPLLDQREPARSGPSALGAPGSWDVVDNGARALDRSHGDRSDWEGTSTGTHLGPELRFRRPAAIGSSGRQWSRSETDYRRARFGWPRSSTAASSGGTVPASRRARTASSKPVRGFRAGPRGNSSGRRNSPPSGWSSIAPRGRTDVGVRRRTGKRDTR